MRPQPILQAAVGHGPHQAEGGGILGFPRIAADQAGQDIQQAQGEQHQARKRIGGGSGKADWLHCGEELLLFLEFLAWRVASRARAPPAAWLCFAELGDIVPEKPCEQERNKKCTPGSA
jgi:hypothetical protein